MNVVFHKLYGLAPQRFSWHRQKGDGLGSTIGKYEIYIVQRKYIKSDKLAINANGYISSEVYY